MGTTAAIKPITICNTHTLKITLETWKWLTFYDIKVYQSQPIFEGTDALSNLQHYFFYLLYSQLLSALNSSFFRFLL